MRPEVERILIVKLSAMGDIIHALPAVSAMKHSFPGAKISWLVKRNWAVLLEGNPRLDEIIPFERQGLGSFFRAGGDLRRRRFDLAIDFQGLMQSALLARLSGARRVFGFDAAAIREKPAAWLYSHTATVTSAHVVDQCLDLAEAAGAGRGNEFCIPAGAPEGDLPHGPFVLATPLAGWAAKQWPLENYTALARLLKVPLVLNGPAGMPVVAGTQAHVSGIPGLIDATRRAHAVIGLDSGPTHLAAALGKPGVAIFGPTDPARNGPYGGSIEVLRSASAITSYRRDTRIAESMRRITPEAVLETLCRVISSRNLTPIS